jgi:hypothetical protein
MRLADSHFAQATQQFSCYLPEHYGLDGRLDKPANQLLGFSLFGRLGIVQGVDAHIGINGVHGVPPG